MNEGKFEQQNSLDFVDLCTWFQQHIDSLSVLLTVMSQNPCRQLNSVAIRDEILASIIPIVRSACSVIGVKCIWRVKGGMYGVQSAWNHIVAKRNECDSVIVKTPGVGFFFSAISTYQSKKGKTSNEDEEVQGGSEDDQDHEEECGQSQQSPNSTEVCIVGNNNMDCFSMFCLRSHEHFYYCLRFR